MMLRISPHGDTPPFEQLRLQIVDQITNGDLPAGTKLPSVRRLAGDLGIAPNTVARTYRELEAAGFVRTAGRNGTVVAGPDTDTQDATQVGRRLADQYVATLQRLGARPEDILFFVQQALAKS